MLLFIVRLKNSFACQISDQTHRQHQFHQCWRSTCKTLDQSQSLNWSTDAEWRKT